MSSSATVPSVGRILHYVPSPNEGGLCWLDQSQPLAAQIILVNRDSTIDVVVWGQDGRSNRRARVEIVPEGATPPNRGYCRWMPYQVAVAKGQLQPAQHADPFKDVPR